VNVVGRSSEAARRASRSAVIAAATPCSDDGLPWYVKAAGFQPSRFSHLLRRPPETATLDRVDETVAQIGAMFVAEAFRQCDPAETSRLRVDVGQGGVKIIVEPLAHLAASMDWCARLAAVGRSPSSIARGVGSDPDVNAAHRHAMARFRDRCSDMSMDDWLAPAALFMALAGQRALRSHSVAMRAMIARRDARAARSEAMNRSSLPANPNDVEPERQVRDVEQRMMASMVLWAGLVEAWRWPGDTGGRVESKGAACIRDAFGGGQTLPVSMSQHDLFRGGPFELARVCDALIADRNGEPSWLTTAGAVIDGRYVVLPDGLRCEHAPFAAPDADTLHTATPTAASVVDRGGWTLPMWEVRTVGNGASLTSFVVTVVRRNDDASELAHPVAFGTVVDDAATHEGRYFGDDVQISVSQPRSRAAHVAVANRIASSARNTGTSSLVS
jgi:hypothetical protein